MTLRTAGVSSAAKGTAPQCPLSRPPVPEASSGQEGPTDNEDKFSEEPPPKEDAYASCRECVIVYKAQLDMQRL